MSSASGSGSVSFSSSRGVSSASSRFLTSFSSTFFPSSTEAPSFSSSSSGGFSSTSGSFSGYNVTRTTHYPLTTIFTAPPRCSEVPFTFSSAHSGLSTFWRNHVDGENSECYPPNFAIQQQATVSAEYSPGVCPSGYLAQASVSNRQRRAITSWCCPSGFLYAQNYGCYSTVTTPTTVIVNADHTSTIQTPFVAVEHYVKVAWATNQLDLFTPASAPVLERQATAVSSSAAAPAGMTSEQIAGMSVGLPVAVAVIALACYAIWRRKRRMAPESALLGGSGSGSGSGSSSGSPEDGITPPQMMQQNGVMEVYKRNDSAQVETPDSATNRVNGNAVARVDPYATAILDPQQRFSFSTTGRPSCQMDETQPATEPR